MVEMDPTIEGLLTHVECYALRSKRHLARTKECLWRPSERVAPREFYESRLPLHQTQHDKWGGWLKELRKLMK